MVLIPAGEFQMGSNDGDSSEKPVHTVYLDDFYMDIYEVTNAQYKKFMDATGHKAPIFWNDPNYNDPKQPVVGVTWEDASAYAKWAGKRLPTEAEWEKAARGGLVGKKYVWGDEWPPPKGSGNFCDETAQKTFPDWDIIKGYDDGYADTAPVGKFNPNRYGLYDMAGNVWEWVADWYDQNYYANSPKQNPKGPNSGSYRVLRGGSWQSGSLTSYAVGSLRVAYRAYYGPPPSGGSYVGFRCVE
jgi:formylglycine-generating enzyme required for sulfatase activity